ncbi:MAG: acyl transferase [Marinilabiliales bacterium]|mgnify:CR=1 FL=1|nr:MAG: acyl transferase [Marinilabiliales bacterium]
MPKLSELEQQIFAVESPNDFNELSLKIFQYQFENNAVYRKYAQNIGKEPSNVLSPESIPFLPISFFKTHKVVTYNKPSEIIFSSSGTGNNGNSKHHIAKLSVYEDSFTKGFKKFYGDAEDYVILALLPSYLERGGSSLVYMAQKLIEKSKHPESGFYLNDYEKLYDMLLSLKAARTKVVLLGVSYALLDMVEKFDLSTYGQSSSQLIVMETGGMKGRRKEMVKEELHDILCKGFGVESIHSEYGMTELLSQAYSTGGGIFNCPPWMQLKIRDVNDPFCLLEQGKSGGINLIDLANIYSCSFIETQDLGKIYNDGSFEIIGRFDNSDVRGCNLMVY